MVEQPPPGPSSSEAKGISETQKKPKMGSDGEKKFQILKKECKKYVLQKNGE